MTAQSFTDAQQVANVAYDMALHETGDIAQASAAYTAVMTAYYAAHDDKQRAGWISNTDRLADDVPMPDPQQVTHAARIRRANVDDEYFAQLVAYDYEPERCEAGGWG